MKFAELCDALSLTGVAVSDTVVSGVAFDSRNVTPGSVFVAVDGNRDKGSRYIGDAISRGASAIISEGPPPTSLAEGVAWLRVPSARKALARAACAFYGDPFRIVLAPPLVILRKRMVLRQIHAHHFHFCFIQTVLFTMCV